MATNGRLEGKVALVTGAGSGIGRETALRFAQEGARVCAADLRGDSARETAAAIGADAIGVELDVTSSGSAGGGRGRRAAAVRRHRRPRQQRRRDDRRRRARARRGRLGRGARRQPEGHLPRLEGSLAAPRRARRRSDPGDGLDRGHLGDPRRRRLLRLEGRGDHAHEVHGARRRQGRHPRQLRLPGVHGDADDRGLLRRPARPRGVTRVRRLDSIRSAGWASRATSPTHSSTWPATRPSGSPARRSSSTAV